MAPVTPAQLQSALASPDQHSVNTATLFARAKAAEPTEIVVTVYDRFWRKAGEAADYIDLTASHPRNNVPVLTMTFKGSDPLVPLLRACRTEVVGITIEVGAIRWAYTVETASLKLANGQRTLEIKCLGLFDYLSYLMVWPNFLLPIQNQIPSRAVYIGPICTVIEVMVAEQSFRMQAGLWELVNNLGSLNLDWRSWFGTLLQSRGNLLDMLHTPIYVVHHNPLFDTSPFVAITSRMESVATVIDKLIKGYGIVVDVDLWLPGDPQPDSSARLSVPTYVVRVSDRSNVTGPTGTILDSVIKQVVNLEESVLGGVLQPFLNPQGLYAPDGVYVAPTIGVNYVKPWAVLVDHPRGPMEGFEITDHHPQGWQIVVGGKSPKWINDLINACVAGDTIIDGPDGGERIDVLAAHGKPFRVWSITPQGERVVATASYAFKKGSAELFRYTLSDGRHIDATARHRFLTDKGFVHASEISPGCRIATVDHADLPPSDHPLARPVNDGDYECLDETDALVYRDVVSVEPLGVHDFYDMHVPGWENYAANGVWNHNTTSWLLDCLMIVIGLTGVPSNLFDGMFNDVILAFQLIENFNRRNDMGPYGRPEKFLPTGAAPYNIDALMSFIQAMWDSRGYRSGQAMFRNGYPYSVGRDIFPGAMMSIAENGTLYTDYIENIIITDNRKERCKVVVQIGDGKGEEAPIARFQRLITGLQESFNVLTLTPG